MNASKHWLLEPPIHSTYHTDRELIQIGSFTLFVEHPKMPVSQSDESSTAEDLVICGSGWTENKLAPQAKAIAEIGVHACSFDHPRKGALPDLGRLAISVPKLVLNWNELSVAIVDEKDPEHAEDIFMEMLDDGIGDKQSKKKTLNTAIDAGKSRRDNLLAVMEEMSGQGYTSIHMLGHSLGGIDATMAVDLAPDRFASLTLDGPGGLMANDSLNDILPRVPSTVAYELRHKRELARTAINTILFVLRNPALTLHEGYYAASSRLEDALWRIVADHKIPTTLILGGNDKMFPTQRVIDGNKDIPFAEMVVLPDAGHNMTTHNRYEIACVMGNIALDLHNKRSGVLEVQMRNLLERRLHKRPSFFAPTNQDIMDDLNYGR